MKINLSGHHVELSDAVRAHVEEKFSKIASHFPTLITLDATITKARDEYQIEVHTKYEGSKISASGNDSVMYPAIAKAAKKLDAALSHRKGQLKGDLHKKPECTTEPIAHEIIQEMKLS